MLIFEANEKKKEEKKPELIKSKSRSVSDEELAALRKIFKEFDVDDSNAIDKGELKKLVTSLGLVEYAQDAKIEETFNALDKSKDGTISFSELLSGAPDWLLDAVKAKGKERVKELLCLIVVAGGKKDSPRGSITEKKPSTPALVFSGSSEKKPGVSFAGSFSFGSDQKTETKPEPTPTAFSFGATPEKKEQPSPTPFSFTPSSTQETTPAPFSFGSPSTPGTPFSFSKKPEETKPDTTPTEKSKLVIKPIEKTEEPVKQETKRPGTISDEELEIFRQVFSECDVDGSAAIDQSELKKLVSKLGLVEYAKDDKIEEAFNAMDLSKDGTVSFREVIARAPEWLLNAVKNKGK